MHGSKPIRTEQCLVSACPPQTCSLAPSQPVLGKRAASCHSLRVCPDSRGVLGSCVSQIFLRSPLGLQWLLGLQTSHPRAVGRRAGKADGASSLHGASRECHPAFVLELRGPSLGLATSSFQETFKNSPAVGVLLPGPERIGVWGSCLHPVPVPLFYSSLYHRRREQPLSAIFWHPCRDRVWW